MKAFVPRYRRSCANTRSPELLDNLEKNGFLVYTPSRFLNGKLIVPYDDRFILEAARFYSAIIVSNDNYTDIKFENHEWKNLVDTRLFHCPWLNTLKNFIAKLFHLYSLLQYTFVDDLFMVADDPMGRHGPSLEEFLLKPNMDQSNRIICKQVAEKQKDQQQQPHQLFVAEQSVLPPMLSDLLNPNTVVQQAYVDSYNRNFFNPTMLTFQQPLLPNPLIEIASATPNKRLVLINSSSPSLRNNKENIMHYNKKKALN